MFIEFSSTINLFPRQAQATQLLNQKATLTTLVVEVMLRLNGDQSLLNHLRND